MLLRIVAPHFVAGIEPGVTAAPIIADMLRWDEARIREYCRAKRWRAERVRTGGDTFLFQGVSYHLPFVG